MKNISRGQIWLADLNPVKGHEQGGYRPVLVLQKNILNRNLNTVVIAPLTTNLTAKGLLTTYHLPKNISKLPHDSVVLLFQIRTVDKARLVKYISALNPDEVGGIREQLMFVV